MELLFVVALAVWFTLLAVAVTAVGRLARQSKVSGPAAAVAAGLLVAAVPLPALVWRPDLILPIAVIAVGIFLWVAFLSALLIRRLGRVR